MVAILRLPSTLLGFQTSPVSTTKQDALLLDYRVKRPVCFYEHRRLRRFSCTRLNSSFVTMGVCCPTMFLPVSGERTTPM